MFFEFIFLGVAGGGCRCLDSSTSPTLNLSPAARLHVYIQENCLTVHQTKSQKITFLVKKL